LGLFGKNKLGLRKKVLARQRENSLQTLGRETRVGANYRPSREGAGEKKTAGDTSKSLRRYNVLLFSPSKGLGKGNCLWKRKI